MDPFGRKRKKRIADEDQRQWAARAAKQVVASKLYPCASDVIDEARARGVELSYGEAESALHIAKARCGGQW